jgi:hypothetical protein
MRYRLESDIGVFFWWIVIKFCKTKLEDEQSEANWSRNILFLVFIGFVIAFFTLVIFKS